MRLNYIDELKGLAIISVIVNHVSFYCGKENGIINEFGTLYQMPLFFFLSGLVTKQIEGKQFKYLINKAKVILLPFIAWGVLLVISRNDSMLEFFADFMKGGYWYLWVLYAFYIFHGLYCLFSAYINKNSSLWGDLGILLLMYVALKVGYRFIPEKLNEFSGYLHWIVYFPFFIAGVLVKKFELSEKLFRSHRLYVSSFAVLFLIWVFRINFTHISFVISSSIIFILCGFFYQIPSNGITKGFSYIGSYTLGIYLIHYFFLPYIHIEHLVKLLTHTSNYIAEAFLFVVIALVISMLCIFVVHVLKQNKYLSAIFLGKIN